MPRGRRRPQRRVVARGPSPLASACEALERRFALAVTWSAGSWGITGDADPANLDDTILVRRNPDD